MDACLYLIPNIFPNVFVCIDDRQDPARVLVDQKSMFYQRLYNIQISARAPTDCSISYGSLLPVNAWKNRTSYIKAIKHKFVSIFVTWIFQIVSGLFDKWLTLNSIAALHTHGDPVAASRVEAIFSGES